MIHKSFSGPVAVKNSSVEAVFATMNTIDADGDILLPGAIEDGQTVPISAYGHTSWQGKLPIGRGTITVRGDEAIIHAELFDTVDGRDTATVLDGLGGLGQWSFGLDIVEAERGTVKGQPANLVSRVTIHEVSPVLRGAGVNTRTLTTGSPEEQAAREAARFAATELDRQLRDEARAIRDEAVA